MHITTPPNNSAWRCRQFILKALQNANQHADIAFAMSLGINGYDQRNPDHHDLVRGAVTSLRLQQRAILKALREHHSVTEELFAPIAAADGALSSMTNLQQVLTNFPQITSREYPLALGWAANILPSTAYSPDEAEVAQVLNDVIALKARLTGMRFPIAVHDFLEQLLKDLETGVATASFEGTASLQRACVRATSEISMVAERLKDAEPNLTDVQRSYLTEAAEKVDKVGKIAGGLSAAITFAQQLAPLIGNAVNAISKT